MPLPFSGWELVLILAIALIVLGPGKLPDLGASMGRTIREFRKAASDVQEATNLDPRPATASAATASSVAASPVTASPAQPARFAAEEPRAAPVPSGPESAEHAATVRDDGSLPVEPIKPEDLATPTGLSDTQTSSPNPPSDRPTIGG